MTTTRGDIETRTVKVPGATLYVEVWGRGPVLLCITGGPTDAGMFTDLAGRLADRYTVVTYDQRGHSRSILEGEPEDIPVALHADDAAPILAVVGEEPAYVYGVSCGATTGLELVARHPDMVPTLVANEPPVMELLPDAEQWRAAFDDIYETYRAEGSFQFVAHEIRQIGGYVPDIDTLRVVPTRIVSAAGETSGEQAARRAAVARRASGHRCDVPARPPRRVGSDPQEFAERLHEVLGAA